MSCFPTPLRLEPPTPWFRDAHVVLWCVSQWPAVSICSAHVVPRTLPAVWPQGLHSVGWRMAQLMHRGDLCGSDDPRSSVPVFTELRHSWFWHYSFRSAPARGVSPPLFPYPRMHCSAAHHLTQTHICIDYVYFQASLVLLLRSKSQYSDPLQNSIYQFLPQQRQKINDYWPKDGPANHKTIKIRYTITGKHDNWLSWIT